MWLHAAIFSGRMLAALLFGVNSEDGLVLTCAGFTLIVIGMLASYIPAARRGTHRPDYRVAQRMNGSFWIIAARQVAATAIERSCPSPPCSNNSSRENSPARKRCDYAGAGERSECTAAGGSAVSRVTVSTVQDGSVYSTRCSAAYTVYRENQWQRRSKHIELES